MKLLCICHANICRSFMAQEFFKQLVPQVEVFSRGLYADPTYVVPQKVMKIFAKYHIPVSQHTSTPLTAADLEQADLIFCMEKAHEERLLDRFSQHTNKIWLLTDFAYNKPIEIEDPISLEGRAFERAADKLYEFCQAAAKRLKQDFKL